MHPRSSARFLGEKTIFLAPFILSQKAKKRGKATIIVTAPVTAGDKTIMIKVTVK
jgi:hypothetical protein